MLSAANIQIDLAPIVRFFAAAKFRIVVRIHVPQKIPARTRPSGHGVVLHTISSGDVPIFLLCTCQRRVTCFRWQVCIDGRQGHLSLPQKLRNIVLIEDRERLPPVTLSAEYGVPQSEIDLSIAYSCFFEEIQCFRDGIFGVQSVSMIRCRSGALLFLNTLPRPCSSLQRSLEWINRIAFANFQSPLISCGDSHNGSCSISGQNIVGYPYRHVVTRQRMDRIAASIAAADFMVACTLPFAFGF